MQLASRRKPSELVNVEHEMLVGIAPVFSLDLGGLVTYQEKGSWVGAEIKNQSCPL
jgi:hypothetical protein